MKRILFATLLSLYATSPALAWSNHALASYRAFERMPEVAQAAAVPAEPLESFLAAGPESRSTSVPARSLACVGRRSAQ